MSRWASPSQHMRRHADIVGLIVVVVMSDLACSETPLSRAVSPGALLPGEPIRTVTTEISRTCPSTDSPDYFFPSRTFFEDPHRDSVIRDHRNAFLRTAREPSLACGDVPREAFRLWTSM